MCGIAGFVDPSPGRPDAATLRAVGGAMTDTLAHRGPDGDGLWSDAEAGVCLGHRRLAVVDLSPAGHQPMESACGRLVVTYNGEIYNCPELRRELEAAGVAFRGHSDTEVIVEACVRWGVEETVARLMGMFAFALWDRSARRLWLVRDRMGIKPLYWSLQGGVLLFGSELKALRVHPAWRGEVDRDALSAFLRFCYVPAPRSIWRGVQKLQPGRILSWSPGAEPTLTTYWDLRRLAQGGHAAMTADEAVDQLDVLLRDAVGRHMVSDVPLGAFLSGGIDSSAVVALMQAQSSRPVRTFSIGFAEAAYDESPHARAVARHLGTDHTELIVEPRHALEVIPGLARHYDEPFGDSSQIPTLLVSELARRHVTVALSGDGGDELFAGYTRYTVARRFGGALAATPVWLRRLAARAVTAVPSRGWDALFEFVPGRLRPSHPGDRLHKLAEVLAVASSDAFYGRLVSHWHQPDRVVVGGHQPVTLVDDPALVGEVPDFVERMQVRDMLTYLPDDILVKVDRASMAVALEARVPLLDHRVVEFALAQPRALGIRHGQGKWALRQVLHRYVPAALVERPKMGFGVPIDAWLRGPLRDWAEALLDERRLRHEGYFDPAPIRTLWSRHLAGTVNGQYALWDVLMFQQWLESQS